MNNKAQGSIKAKLSENWALMRKYFCGLFQKEFFWIFVKHLLA